MYDLILLAVKVVAYFLAITIPLQLIIGAVYMACVGLRWCYFKLSGKVDPWGKP